MHMAIGAVVNAVWDLRGQARGQAAVAAAGRDVDPSGSSRWSTSATSPTRSRPPRRWRSCSARGPARRDRSAQLAARDGYPAYTTSPGWLGYSDDEARPAVPGGGRRRLRPDQAQGRRRPRRRHAPRCGSRVRSSAPDIRIAIDANQRWDVGEAIELDQGARPSYDPYWIEEPTSPDDVLGHAAIRKAVAPVKVATGEHVQNRVVFKQLLQAGAIDVVQIDAARVGGRQREPRDPAARGEVRRAGLPARRRRRPVRARPAPVDVRLRRGLRHDRGPRHRVRRPPPRALHRPGGDARRPLPRPAAPGFSAAMRRSRSPRTRYPDGACWLPTTPHRDGSPA